MIQRARGNVLFLALALATTVVQALDQPILCSREAFCDRDIYDLGYIVSVARSNVKTTSALQASIWHHSMKALVKIAPESLVAEGVLLFLLSFSFFRITQMPARLRAPTPTPTTSISTGVAKESAIVGWESRHRCCGHRSVRVSRRNLPLQPHALRLTLRVAKQQPQHHALCRLPRARHQAHRHLLRAHQV